MIVVVMGVSGSGKSTLLDALTARLGWRGLEADDLHSRTGHFMPATLAQS